MRGSHVVKRHVSTIDRPYKVVGHMSKEEAKNIKEKSIEDWHVKNKNMQKVMGISKELEECFTSTMMGYKYGGRNI